MTGSMIRSELFSEEFNQSIFNTFLVGWRVRCGLVGSSVDWIGESDRADRFRVIAE